MKKYIVTGMTCAACQARVEKAVSKVAGVQECSVSLLTNSMGVEGSASPKAIIKAVEKAGYSASLVNDTDVNNLNSAESQLENKELPVLKKRLIWSVSFLVVLMYVSMGHMMWGWPVPSFLHGNHFAIGLIQMILAAIIIVINKKFFISGFRSVLHGAPNMDTLVALGSGVSFIYSVVVLFTSDNIMDNLYFESAGTILTLITVGKLLESVSKGKTTNALKSLMKLSPKTAVIIKDGQEKEVPIEEVSVDDIFVVKPGESIPVDGIVIEGSSAVNEAALTGESIPVDKIEGSGVSAATINTSGYLKCKATRIGKDTTLSQIIQMVSDAAATKAPIAKIADKVSGVFVPAVIVISVVTFVVWFLFGAEFAFALSKAICVLVVSCPCALGLATPVAIMVGNGVGAKNGILFKTSASLEATGRTQIVALDKTGTITLGQPKVVQVLNNNFTEIDLVYRNLNDIMLLQAAINLEVKSEHPLAKAVVEFAKSADMVAEELLEWQAVGGQGVKGKNGDTEYFAGNYNFIQANTSILENAELNQKLNNFITKIAQRGQTPLIFSTKTAFLGIISVADVIKEEAPKTIKQLKNMGIHVVMLTGDNEVTAKSIATQVGVDEVIAGVLPEGKETVIRALKNKGKVAMVGDGINDAPALTRADIGIAIGAGTDVAIDAADIVLVKSHLDDVPAAINLSRRTLTNIHENLFWAFFYNVILIPIAAGVYYNNFGLQMNPMLGAAAMSLSSFCVVSNALRLNLINIKK